MERQVIHLRLRKDYYETYLRKKFRTKSKEPICITRRCAVGKFIHSQVKAAEFPARSQNEHTTPVVLSEFEVNNSAKRFLSISKEGMERINDFLDAIIEVESREMLVVGRELGYETQTIINIFILHVLGTEKFDMIKKSDYRLRRKIEETLLAQTQQLGVQLVKK